MEAFKTAAAMVLVQILYAGVNIFYKLALNYRMDIRIMVTYRYLFAAASLIPIAYLFFFFFFFFGWPIFRCTLAQSLYLASVSKTSVTFAAAMGNLIPAITFILAVLFRLENLRINKLSGQAKVLGTVIGVCGAMLLTFYKGPDVPLWSSSINLLPNNQVTPLHNQSGNRVMASLFAVASCLSYSLWLIIQAKMSEVYPCPYSTTALVCSMASLQSFLLAIIMQRDMAQWRLGFNIRLLAVSYAGILGSSMTFTLLAWCIRKKGPLYASVFNPLMLIIVAILSTVLLNDKLHLGSMLSAGLIVSGLYIVLWGKKKEAKKSVELDHMSLVDAQ
ncbi:WAT1-related protein [Dioscorea alata]|uniref:WAT1-related protein n=1 Tax=Dioscorea alata TaxID=55571 RepID=A0ACB7W049_DIOAL|nr:WAT1-related protein [Dioscorea alata]